MPRQSKIWLDESLQVIRQQLIGPTDESEALWIIDQTIRCSSMLKDPSCVRILLDGQKLGKISLKGRQALAKMQKKPEMNKLASWGINLLDRTVIRFINMVTGMNKMMAFKDEKAAIKWLLE
jgi:hypothetical protein